MRERDAKAALPSGRHVQVLPAGEWAPTPRRAAPLTISSESLGVTSMHQSCLKLPIRLQCATTALEPSYSKCGPQTGSSGVSGGLLEMQNLRSQLRPSESESAF